MANDNIFEGLNLEVLSRIPAIGPDAEVEIIEPKTAAEKAEEARPKTPEPIKSEDLGTYSEPKEVESIEDLFKSDEEPVTTEQAVVEETQETAQEDPVGKVWAQWAAEKGLIEYKEEEYEDGDAYLIKKFEDQVSKKFTEWQTSLPEPIKELIENYKEGVPLGRLLELETAIQEYSSVKPEDLEKNENLQKSVVADFLNRDGNYTEEELDAELKELEDTGMLLNRAKRALPKMLEIEKMTKQLEIDEAKRTQKDSKERYDNWTKDFRRYLDTKEELISGYKLDEKARKTIHDSITKVVGRDSQGRPLNAIAKRRIEDPDYDAKIAYISEVLNFDLSAAERKGVTKGVQGIKVGAKPAGDHSQLSKVDISVVRKALKRFK